MKEKISYFRHNWKKEEIISFECFHKNVVIHAVYGFKMYHDKLRKAV